MNTRVQKTSTEINWIDEPSDLIDLLNQNESYQTIESFDHTVIKTDKTILVTFLEEDRDVTVECADLLNNYKDAILVILHSINQLDSVTTFAQSDFKTRVFSLVLPIQSFNLQSYLATASEMIKTKALNQDISPQQTSNEIFQVLSISRELNGERNIPKLLNLILTKAREVTKADAGSIYTVESPPGYGLDQALSDGQSQMLQFRFTQNDSIEQTLTDFTIPIDDHSIVGNAVLHQKPINIPDLYKLSENPKENPYHVTHDRSWDQRIQYQSRSMLTIPMFDISHSVIGVIQLINCKKDLETRLHQLEDFSEKVIAFNDNAVEFGSIVGQQAGIALENAKMQADIQNLFDGFVNASVTAIELRDPTTSGHSHRVAALTVGLAQTVDQLLTGPLKSVSFTLDQMTEIKYASLLHDFGKLGVREHVLLKAKKLYPEQYSLIEQRFKLIRASIEIDFLKKSVSFYKTPSMYPSGVSELTFQHEREQKLLQLDQHWQFICSANEPTILEKGGFEYLKDIANCSFHIDDRSHGLYLTDIELSALSVSRGSLTAAEVNEIQSHVSHTYEFLRKIPWGRKLANVPHIAAKHHEKLDGTGYPTASEANEIPIQSRMMAITDIFDALTAADRPYKKAVPQEKALDILNMEVKSGKLDPNLFQVFVESQVFLQVNKKII